MWIPIWALGTSWLLAHPPGLGACVVACASEHFYNGSACLPCPGSFALMPSLGLAAAQLQLPIDFCYRGHVRAVECHAWKQVVAPRTGRGDGNGPCDGGARFLQLS